MEKLRVTVGFVFTQVMFVDGHGKIHFHRVMTDVDKPWKSVKEVLGLVKDALGLDKPHFNEFLKSLHIELQFKTIHFTSLLASLREELVNFVDRACQLTIQVFDQMEEAVCSEESMEEEEQVAEPGTVEICEMGQAMPSDESRLFPIYREADAVLVIPQGTERVNIHANRKGNPPFHFFVDEDYADAVTKFDQRGSP